MKMTAQGFLTALKSVNQHDIDSVAWLVSTIHVDPKQLEGAQALIKELHAETQRIDAMAGLKAANEEVTGDIAVTAIAFAMGRAAGLAHFSAAPSLSTAVDDIAAIAHGEGYDAGAGCSRYDATQAWDNFKQHSLPILKQRIHGMPVPGYVQVPVEKLKAAHLNAKIAEETLCRGYQEMKGMRCGFTDTACTHAGIAKNELLEMLEKAQENQNGNH